MKRLTRWLVILLAVLLVCSALADPDASFDAMSARESAIMQRLHAIELERQIVQLNAELAVARGDADAQSAAEEALALLDDEEAQLEAELILLLTKTEMLISSEYAALWTEKTALEEALAACRTEQLGLRALTELVQGGQARLTGRAYSGLSMVTVEVTVNANMCITGLTVDTSGENPTDAYFVYDASVMADEAFLSQFIGLMPPISLYAEVKPVSGAEGTCWAVVDAVNDALADAEGIRAYIEGSYAGKQLAEMEAIRQEIANLELERQIAQLNLELAELMGDEEAYSAAQAALSTPNQKEARLNDELQSLQQRAASCLISPTALEKEEAALEQSLNDLRSQLLRLLWRYNELHAENTAMSGFAYGHSSYVTVHVALDDELRISGILLDASGETTGRYSLRGVTGYGERVMENEAFQAQFIGQSLPVALGEGVEAISGATETSQAVVDAINQAYDDALWQLTALNREMQVLQKSLPAAYYMEEILPEGHRSVTAVYEAVDADGQALGHVVTAYAPGYGGDVYVTLGVGLDGRVTGISIGDSNFRETVGFGFKWKDETDRWEQFKGIDTTLADNAIEAIAGATVTSKAVLNATNAAINCVNDLRGLEARDVVFLGEPKPPEPVELTGPVHEGSARGFSSEVRVQVQMEGGVITALGIDSSGETPGFGQNAMEPYFYEQFIGQTAPVAYGDSIEMLSGATITSSAVIEAINRACASSADPDAAPFGSGAEDAVEVNAEPVPEGTLTASAPGFMGNDVTVTVTLNADGTIATLEIDTTKQVAPNGEFVQDEAFIGQFIGKVGPFVIGEGIDGVSGATFTATGVVDALNSLFPAEAPVEEPAEASPSASASADTLTASAPGFMGNDVGVSVTMNVDGSIATLDIDVSTQLPPVCDLVLDEAFIGQFIGKAGPFVVGEDVDVVSGATFTAEAVIEALNSLFPAETLTATASGFCSDVAVTVTLAEDGSIATLDIDASGETAGFGQCAMESAFTEQFVGKAGPFAYGEGVDALSGATITSDAVLEALNSLFN